MPWCDTVGCLIHRGLIADDSTSPSASNYSQVACMQQGQSRLVVATRPGRRAWLQLSFRTPHAVNGTDQRGLAGLRQLTPGNMVHSAADCQPVTRFITRRCKKWPIYVLFPDSAGPSCPWYYFRLLSSCVSPTSGLLLLHLLCNTPLLLPLRPLRSPPSANPLPLPIPTLPRFSLGPISQSWTACVSNHFLNVILT